MDHTLSSDVQPAAPVADSTIPIMSVITGTLDDDLYAPVAGGGTFSISDPGGLDRISAQDTHALSVIDLREGHSSTLNVLRLDGSGVIDTTTYLIEPGTILEYGIGQLGSDRIFGNDQDNYLHGDALNDTMHGFAGDDTIHAGDGWDFVFGGDGNDLIRFGYHGSNTASGDAGNDTIHGSISPDYLLGGTGDDLLFGGDGRDTIYGGEGNDTLSDRDDTALNDSHTADRLEGGYGDDLVYGGLGDDLLAGQDGNDTVQGGAGADRIFGGNHDDSLQGGAGADHIRGGTGSDNIAGGTGFDRLFGDDGDDFINPGDAADIVWGGAGADRFYSRAPDPSAPVAPHDATDRIMDYDAAQGDLLVLGQEFHRGTIHIHTSFANSGLGNADIAEAFIWDAQAVSLLWIIADGAAMDTINLWNGGLIYDVS